MTAPPVGSVRGRLVTRLGGQGRRVRALGLPLRAEVGLSRGAASLQVLLGLPSVHRAPETLRFEQVLKAGESQNILFFPGHGLLADGNICTLGRVG